MTAAVITTEYPVFATGNGWWAEIHEHTIYLSVASEGDLLPEAVAGIIRERCRQFWTLEHQGECPDGSDLYILREDGATGQ